MPKPPTPMPKTAETPPAAHTIAGIRRLLNWLENHRDIPFVHVDYASNDYAELTLESGGFEMLAAAVTAARSLDDTEITVVDASSLDGQRHWCQLTVTGLTAADTDTPIRITVAGICFDEAADVLRNSLGAPPIPDESMWWGIPTEHVASLLPAAGA